MQQKLLRLPDWTLFKPFNHNGSTMILRTETENNCSCNKENKVSDSINTFFFSWTKINFPMRDIFEINEKTRKIFITAITLVPFLQKKNYLKARVGKAKSLYVDWLSQIQLWTTREEATTHTRLKKLEMPTENVLATLAPSDWSSTFWSWNLQYPESECNALTYWATITDKNM